MYLTDCRALLVTVFTLFGRLSEGIDVFDVSACMSGDEFQLSSNIPALVCCAACACRTEWLLGLASMSHMCTMRICTAERSPYVG